MEAVRGWVWIFSGIAHLPLSSLFVSHGHLLINRSIHSHAACRILLFLSESRNSFLSAVLVSFCTSEVNLKKFWPHSPCPRFAMQFWSFCLICIGMKFDCNTTVIGRNSVHSPLELFRTNVKVTIFPIGWDQTSAYIRHLRLLQSQAAAADLTHPPDPCNGEMYNHTGNYVPYSFQQACVTLKMQETVPTV